MHNAHDKKSTRIKSAQATKFTNRWRMKLKNTFGLRGGGGGMFLELHGVV